MNRRVKGALIIAGTFAGSGCLLSLVDWFHHHFGQTEWALPLVGALAAVGTLLRENPFPDEQGK